jgi:uridine kinase
MTERTPPSSSTIGRLPLGLSHGVKKSFERWINNPGVRELLRSRLFWTMLVVKLVLGATVASSYMRDLFVPFLNYFVESGFSNPWEHFAQIGRLNSFPYPPVMLYLLSIPRLLLEPFLLSGVDTVTNLHLLTMRLPLLAADLVITLILIRWFPYRVKRVLLFFWCSPFVIYITYWHGQLDIIPTALFVCSLYVLRNNHYALAMVFLGFALATKTHLLAALPFLLVYLYQKVGLRRSAIYTLVSLGVYFLLILPYLPGDAFRLMVFGTEEQSRLFAFHVPLGSGNLSILLAPAVIMVLWFRFSAYARRNWDLFMLYLGILFSVFVLLVPPRPGYFLWSLPFIVFFMCRSSKTYSMPYHVYAISYLAFFWLAPQSDLFDAWRVTFSQAVSWPPPLQILTGLLGAEKVGVLSKMIYTVMEVSLAGIVINMYLFGIRSNAVYRMKTTPTMIGIAGDSAAGKDTCVELTSRVLGSERVTVVAGDDYHKWPRGHEMWKVYTHLDARANELHLQHEHAIAIRDGKTVIKGNYDHGTGQFTEERSLDPDQYVIYNGLHVLSIEAMRKLYDIKVFMDPEENLRRFWKVRRDCLERGYSPEKVQEALADREDDRQKYILPQRDHSDLVVSWAAKSDLDMTDLSHEPELTLRVTAANSFNFSRLLDGMKEIDTLTVDHEPFVDTVWQSLSLSGTVGSAELYSLAHAVISDLEEVAPMPEFTSGLNGCLQLVFLVCLSERMRWGGK